MRTQDSDTKVEIQHLKQQIDTLNEAQAKALKQAAYVGMTRAEAKVCDERREEIKRLVAELSRLCEEQ